MIYMNGKVLSYHNARVDVHYDLRLDGYVTDGGKYIPAIRNVTGTILLTSCEQDALGMYFPTISLSYARVIGVSIRQCIFELKITNKERTLQVIRNCRFSEPEPLAVQSEDGYGPFKFTGNCIYDATIDDCTCGKE